MCLQWAMWKTTQGMEDNIWTMFLKHQPILVLTSLIWSAVTVVLVPCAIAMTSGALSSAVPRRASARKITSCSRLTPPPGGNGTSGSILQIPSKTRIIIESEAILPIVIFIKKEQVKKERKKSFFTECYVNHLGQIPNAKFLFCKCCFITDHTGSWMLITHARCCVSVFLYRTGNSCRCFIPTLSASMCKTFAFSGGTDELLVLWRLSKTPSMTGRSSGRNRTSRFCTTALSVFPIDLKGKAKKMHSYNTWQYLWFVEIKLTSVEAYTWRQCQILINE